MEDCWVSRSLGRVGDDSAPPGGGFSVSGRGVRRAPPAPRPRPGGPVPPRVPSLSPPSPVPLVPSRRALVPASNCNLTLFTCPCPDPDRCPLSTVPSLVRRSVLFWASVPKQPHLHGLPCNHPALSLSQSLMKLGSPGALNAATCSSIPPCPLRPFLSRSPLAPPSLAEPTQRDQPQAQPPGNQANQNLSRWSLHVKRLPYSILLLGRIGCSSCFLIFSNIIASDKPGGKLRNTRTFSLGLCMEFSV